MERWGKTFQRSTNPSIPKVASQLCHGSSLLWTYFEICDVSSGVDLILYVAIQRNLQTDTSRSGSFTIFTSIIKNLQKHLDKGGVVRYNNKAVLKSRKGRRKIRKENIKKVLTNGRECDIIDKLFRTADKRKRVHRSLKIKQYCKERTDPEDSESGKRELEAGGSFKRTKVRAEKSAKGNS